MITSHFFMKSPCKRTLIMSVLERPDALITKGSIKYAFAECKLRIFLTISSWTSLDLLLLRYLSVYICLTPELCFFCFTSTSPPPILSLVGVTQSVCVTLSRCGRLPSLLQTASHPQRAVESKMALSLMGPFEGFFNFFCKASALGVPTRMER